MPYFLIVPRFVDEQAFPRLARMFPSMCVVAGQRWLILSTNLSLQGKFVNLPLCIDCALETVVLHTIALA